LNPPGVQSNAGAASAPATRRILPGEYAVTGDDDTLVTVLGSCISACIRDPVAKVGGMNHFMLPEDGGGGDRWLDPKIGLATRYGSYAMESLINDLLKRGAKRERFEIKLFGGGQILISQTDVGKRNIAFIHDFLEKEGLKAVAEDLGGHSPRMLAYFPRTGKARVKHMAPLEGKVIAESERAYMTKIAKEDQGGEIDLFE
jgi:chemotaxis protein CheD